MQIKINFPVWGIDVYLSIIWLLISFVPHLSAAPDPPSTAILLNANKVNVKRVFYRPYRVINKRKSPFYDFPSRGDDYYDDGPGPEFSDSDSFHIEPEDAVDDLKYSPPVIESHPKRYFFPGNHPVPSRPSSVHPSYRDTFMPSPHSVATRPSVEYDYAFQGSVNNPVIKGYKHLDSVPKRDSGVVEATVTSDYKIEDELLRDAPAKDENLSPRITHRNHHLSKNNFTDTNDSQALVPSDMILNFQPPPAYDNEPSDDDRHRNNKHLQNWSRSVPTITTTQVNYLLPENNTVVPFIESETLLKNNREVPTYLGTVSSDVSAQFTTTTTTTKGTVNLIDNDTMSTPSSFDEKENISKALPPVESSQRDRFSSGAVAGIVIAILCGVTVLTSSVIYLLYRRCNGKCTSVVESKFNSDNCGYLDDSLRSSVYLNNHIELPKENSEEMTSLDNDSFLNSLETMTIQNYWADNTKNTKV